MPLFVGWKMTSYRASQSKKNNITIHTSMSSAVWYRWSGMVRVA